MKKIGEKLNQTCDQHGIESTVFGSSIGLAGNSISNIEESGKKLNGNDHSKISDISHLIEKLRAVSHKKIGRPQSTKVLQKTPNKGFILSKDVKYGISRPTPAIKSAIFYRDVPILGQAQGGDEGSLVMNETAIDWTYRPADLDGVQDAFAVYVTGGSMSPTFENGDLVFINPHLSVVRGKHVLVETTDHRGLIKRMDRWVGDILVLKQSNPEKEIHLSRNDIRHIMCVVEKAEK